MPSKPNKHCTCKYTTLAAAPIKHRQMARLKVGGFSHAEIAAACQSCEEYVDAVMSNPVIAAHVETIQAQRYLQQASRKEDLDELINTGLIQLRDALTDPDTPAATKLKITEFACDRHHEAGLQKGAVMRHTVESVQSAASLVDLRDRALRLGAIKDVTPDPDHE